MAAELLKDPDVASLTSYIGVDGTNTTLNIGRYLINLVPLGQRTSSQADDPRAPAPARRPTWPA